MIVTNVSVKVACVMMNVTRTATVLGMRMNVVCVGIYLALVTHCMRRGVMKDTKKYVCGFCITSNHDQCKVESIHFEIINKCECFCQSINFSDQIRERMIEEHYGM